MSFFGHGSIREEEVAKLAQSEEQHNVENVRAFESQAESKTPSLLGTKNRYPC